MDVAVLRCLCLVGEKGCFEGLDRIGCRALVSTIGEWFRTPQSLLSCLRGLCCGLVRLQGKSGIPA